MQLDLWRYPMQSGYKVSGPSKEAALAIEAIRAPKLRDQFLTLFKCGFSGTADEASAKLGVSILSGRPRCAELHARNLIRDTGLRRVSDGGRLSTVWCLS